MKQTPMTVEGAQKLKDELAHLKSVERPKIINAIAEARAHGDLKENAEYHAAKEQQGFVEGRITEIESKLATARVIDIKSLTNDGRVVFGCTVELENVESGAIVRYTIVGDDEADIKEQKISVSSPIARALIGKEEDDEVTVDAPGGEVSYVILSVEY